CVRFRLPRKSSTISFPFGRKKVKRTGLDRLQLLCLCDVHPQSSPNCSDQHTNKKQRQNAANQSTPDHFCIVKKPSLIEKREWFSNLEVTVTTSRTPEVHPIPNSEKQERYGQSPRKL